MARDVGERCRRRPPSGDDESTARDVGERCRRGLSAKVAEGSGGESSTRADEGSDGEWSARADESSNGESSTRANESSGGELLVKTTSEVVPRSDLLSQGLV